MEQRLYTLKEITKIIGVSYNHLVNRIVKTGQLETINIGHGKRTEHRVTQQALDEFLAKHSGGPKRTIKDSIAQLQELRGGSIIISYLTTLDNPIAPNDALFFADVLEDIKKRKGIQGKINTLDLFLNSLGGSLEAAYKVARLLRQYSDKVNVIVPIYAKSAATAICLGANEITMIPVAELGPVDPIVEDPITKAKIPARSIKIFLSYASNQQRMQLDKIDPEMIKVLGGKIDPVLAGAYFNTINTSKEYLNILLSEYMFKGENDSEKINSLIEYFTETHSSHAFVIDFEEAKKIGLKVKLANPDEETAIKQLLGFYTNFMNANQLTKLVGNEFFMIHQSQQLLQRKGGE